MGVASRSLRSPAVACTQKQRERGRRQGRITQGRQVGAAAVHSSSDWRYPRWPALQAPSGGERESHGHKQEESHGQTDQAGAEAQGGEQLQGLRQAGAPAGQGSAGHRTSSLSAPAPRCIVAAAAVQGRAVSREQAEAAAAGEAPTHVRREVNRPQLSTLVRAPRSQSHAPLTLTGSETSWLPLCMVLTSTRISCCPAGADAAAPESMAAIPGWSKLG